MNSFLWKIGGEAGFGIMTTGLAISKLATRSGHQIYDYAEYPSLIRGGHNTYDVLISTDKVSATKHEIDLLICLNKATFELHKHRLSATSTVVYDPDEFVIEGEYHLVPIPFKKIRTEHNAQVVMMNTVAIGASVALMDGDINLYFTQIEEEFTRKGSEVVEYNKTFARLGYDEVKKNFSQYIQPVLKKQSEVTERMVMTGNEAFSLAAVAADCRFYSAYPMTPTSAVLGILAGWAEKTGMVVRHAEDEVAVINTALGASFGGVRSAVGTSGGGFALMVEGISYAGIAELPLVIFLGQRPGPATGMPTWTEQGDLLFAVHAGHGEFQKIVLAPGDIEEMFELTVKAFDLADMYQLPVIILGDKLLCESHQSLETEKVTTFTASYQPNYGKTVRTPSEQPYLRYNITDDGISERLIPGFEGVYYQANSYEHLEDSHTTEEAAPRIAQVQKRSRKWQTYLKNDFAKPTIYGDFAKAEKVLVSWGANKGILLEAQKKAKEQGIEFAYLHFTHLYPLDTELVASYFTENKQYILVENNSEAQFGKLLRAEVGIDLKEKWLKYDGRPWYVEELVEKLKIRFPPTRE
ncbi:2-oxoacid:acceptor oxidoreductase subunit alpha [Candidatus Roizmanbacteria bacterium]|nr:2-oxoacid:acceptor oxidoreductase subunit alpha [Candidatus Roizmanbacteria bacterium]